MSHSSSTSRGGCCGGSSGKAMSAGNVPAASTKAGGCSCGGSCGGSGGCGCDCGGCQGQGQGFARPRFFAGQLLTEDDLDLLESYVVEKNRLHNRSFLGEGVVCGLLVTCDPCGGGRVTVQSGYALDCCGNDIVVPCSQSLDVNAYVRRLRIERTGGVDCGDPCTEERAKALTKSTSTTSTTGTSTSTSTGTGPTGVIVRQPTTWTKDAPPPLPAAEYCLYIRYCEQSTDPISPYATDDPCGAQACEPTRVREGFSFELRCRNCEEEEPDNLFTRISECVGDLLTTERTARNLRSAIMYGKQLTPALSRVTRPDSAKAIVSPERIEAAQLAKIRIEALPKPETWKAAQLYEAADSAQTLASLVAANQALTDEDRKAMGGDAKALEDAAKSAQDTLKKFQETLPDDDKINALITDPLDRELTTSTLKQSILWSNQAGTGVSSGERELLAGGIVYSKKIRSSLATVLRQGKAILLDRLGKRGAVTDCTLLRDLNAIEIPDDDPDSETSTANALVASAAYQQLADVFFRYLRECICAGINPPCPPCDDPAVLLACLRVEGCEVRDICNLERTFVLSPVVYRYWMPFLRSFGNIIERFCCPDNSCDPPKDTNEDDKSVRRPLALKAEIRDSQPRSYLEKNSALNLADAWLGAGKQLDPAQLSVVMPKRMNFSPDDARRLVSSTAAVLDIAGLRRGVAPGELLGLLVRPPTTPSVPAPPPPPAAPAAPAAPPAEVAGLKKDVEDLKAKLSRAEELNKEQIKKFEAKFKKLGV